MHTTQNNSPASISVVIPTYNCGRYIGEAIQSVLRQSLLPEEIIVIDDGSTDDTAQVVRELQDPRIIYFYQENAGVSAARNVGLSMCSCTFVAFLDADDRWYPTMLEKQFAVLTRDESIVCVIANFVRFNDATGETLAAQFSYYPELDKIPTIPLAVPHTFKLAGDPFCALVAFAEHHASTGVMMFRRSLIGPIRFDEALRICEDTAFVMQTYMRGAVAFNTEVLAEVRRHDHNATRDYSLIALDKLKALRSVGPFVASPLHRAAYDARLVRTHVVAARLLCRRGDWRAGVAVFRESLRIKGSTSRKLKGAIRLLLDLRPRSRR